MTSRREVLRGAGGMITLVLANTACTFDKAESEEINAAAFSDHQLLTLTQILQHILPHAALDSAVYADAVAAIARQSINSGNKHKLLVEGVAALDASTIWLDAGASAQVAALKAAEKTPFFLSLQQVAIEQVYRDDRTWQLVGYEGEAIKFGGYLNRGFNDIDWLPSAPGQSESVE